MGERRPLPDVARTAYANRLNGETIAPSTALEWSRITIENDIAKYFRELKIQQEKDGMGISERTLTT